jgi:hypothetical protein
MNWKSLVATVFMVPVLAVFAGISILAWQIGGQWDERHTDQLITGIVATCGLVLAVFLLIAGLVVLALFLLARHRSQREAEQWTALPAQPARRPGWAAGPPQLTDSGDMGSWEALPDGYDTWDDSANDKEITGFRW